MANISTKDETWTLPTDRTRLKPFLFVSSRKILPILSTKTLKYSLSSISESRVILILEVFSSFFFCCSYYDFLQGFSFLRKIAITERASGCGKNSDPKKEF